MRCPYCDNSVPHNVVQCPSCGAAITPQNTATQNVNPGQPVNSMQPNIPAVPKTNKNRITAGLLALCLGALGIHKFYLGYNTAGIIYLLCGTIGWVIGFPGLAVMALAVIDGIIYLTKTDEEFYRVYVEGRKEWF